MGCRRNTRTHGTWEEKDGTPETYAPRLSVPVPVRDRICRFAGPQGPQHVVTEPRNATGKSLDWKTNLPGQLLRNRMKEQEPDLLFYLKPPKNWAKYRQQQLADIQYWASWDWSLRAGSPESDRLTACRLSDAQPRVPSRCRGRILRRRQSESVGQSPQCRELQRLTSGASAASWWDQARGNWKRTTPQAIILAHRQSHLVQVQEPERSQDRHYVAHNA